MVSKSPSKGPTPLRLPDSLLERVRAIAKEEGISFSAAARMLMTRGAAQWERDAKVVEREEKLTAPPQQRRVISKGIF